MPSIQPRSLVTPEQQRVIKAALKLKGLTQAEFAAEHGVSMRRLNRLINGAELVSKSYAQLLNSLLDSVALKPAGRRTSTALAA